MADQGPRAAATANDRPSWTAQGAVAQRAVLDERGAIDDPLAIAMLTRGLASTVRVLARAPRTVYRRAVTLAGAAASLRWFDAEVAAAFDDCITQVAVVGAGFDSRAWRCARPGVRFFELDRRASQDAKRAAAPHGPGPTYVVADLLVDDALGALVGAGLDPDRPTLVVIEMVTMYLTAEAVHRQLAGLAALPVGSRLAVNFFPTTGPSTKATARQLRAQQLLRRGRGERFTFRADPAAAAALVDEAGWTVERVVSLRDAACSLVPASAGLPVDAVDPRKTLLAAFR